MFHQCGHGCMKPVITTDNYYDRPLTFYLKQHVFEQNAWLYFCDVFGMSVTYKIGHNNFDGNYI